MVVDDLFPCYQMDGEWVPLFCRPSYGEQNAGNEMELWAMIVEKAFAKMHGCYQVIDGGNCGDACSYLTGGDVVKLNVDQGEGYFDAVATQLGKDSYVSCSVRPQAPAASAESAGLVPGHACTFATTLSLRVVSGYILTDCLCLCRRGVARGHDINRQEASDAEEPSRRRH